LEIWTETDGTVRTETGSTSKPREKNDLEIKEENDERQRTSYEGS